jgi:holo-[acyl-carrier protein] synthase
MIKGIGNDIIEIERIKQAILRYGDKFLDKLYTSKEKAYCLTHRESHRHFAGRFAAKESILKALGTGLRDEISWLDIEILNDAYGKPYVHLSEKLKARFSFPKVHISISHSKDFATAVAIRE